MSLIMRLFLVLVSVATSLQSRDPNINLIVLECARDSGQNPAVLAQNFSSSTESHNATLRVVDAVTYDLGMRLAQGRYHISVKTSNCRSDFTISVIDGVPRHVTVPIGRIAFLRNAYSGSIAGRLPFAVENVTLAAVSNRRSQRIATIDNGAYYVEDVPVGKYVLRVTLIGGLEFDRGVEITTPNQMIRSDISQEQIREGLGTPLFHGGTAPMDDWKP